MTVSLKITSDFLLNDDYADSLVGGGTGIDLLQNASGSYSPLIDKSTNQGQKTLYISHDGGVEITDTKFFIQIYGTDTGFTYGGDNTASGDYSSLLSLGAASNSSKNNADGLSGGLWMDFNSQGDDTTRFDRANNPDDVKIFGQSDSGNDGSNLSKGFNLKTSAMQYDSGGGVAAQASAPVDGKIGSSGDTVLGDRAKIALRSYLPTGSSVSGVRQWEYVCSYSFSI